MDDSSELVKALESWLKAVMRGTMSGFVRYSRESGLSASQLGVLFQLNHRGQTCGVSDIGDHLGVTSAAASQMLNPLVEQDLIVRTEDPADRRAKRIELTDRGRAVIEHGMKGRQMWFASLVDGMTVKERKTVLAGMRILTKKLGEMDPELFFFEQPVVEKESGKE